MSDSELQSKLLVYLSNGNHLVLHLTVEQRENFEGNFDEQENYATEMLQQLQAMDKVPVEVFIVRTEFRGCDRLTTSGDVNNCAEQPNDVQDEGAVSDEDIEFENECAASSFWTKQITVMMDGKTITNPTELLIRTYGLKKFQEMFNGKTIKRVDVWAKIAEQMAQFGCKVPPGKNGEKPGVVCDIKFRAIKPVYYKHKAPKTGEGKRKKPFYFDTMDEVIGDHQLTSPKNLRDTIWTTTPTSSEGNSEENEDPDEPTTPLSSLGNSGSKRVALRNVTNLKKKLKPSSSTSSDRLLNYLEKSEERARKEREEERRERAQLLKEMHQIDVAQTERLIEALVANANKK